MTRIMFKAFLLIPHVVKMNFDRESAIMLANDSFENRFDEADCYKNRLL